jgi:hypothetical protein
VTAADTVVAAALLAVVLLAGALVMWQGWGETADPDAMAAWHRGIAALKRVTRTRSTPPGHGRGGSDVSPTESPHV